LKIICFDISEITDEKFDFLYNQSTEERKIKSDKYRKKEDKIRCIVSGALLEYALKELISEKKAVLRNEKGNIFLDFDILKNNKENFTKLLEIQKNKYGKPFLKNVSNFNFNISHSGIWVVIGFGSEKIGVDIEKISQNKTELHKKLAERYFTPKEVEYIFENQKSFPQRFAEIWTGKEAFFKYKGTGIINSINSIDITELKGNGLSGITFEKEYFLSTFSPKNIENIEIINFESLHQNN